MEEMQVFNSPAFPYALFNRKGENMETKVGLVVELEKMVDKHGLLHIVTALDCMCSEKADHVEMNWQDKTLAREWRRAANTLMVSARKIQDLSI